MKILKRLLEEAASYEIAIFKKVRESEDIEENDTSVSIQQDTLASHELVNTPPPSAATLEPANAPSPATKASSVTANQSLEPAKAKLEPVLQVTAGKTPPFLKQHDPRYLAVNQPSKDKSLQEKRKIALNALYMLKAAVHSKEKSERDAASIHFERFEIARADGNFSCRDLNTTEDEIASLKLKSLKHKKALV